MALSQRYLSWFWTGIFWPVTETSLELCVLLPSMLIGSTLSLVLPSLAAGLSGSSTPYDHFGSLSQPTTSHSSHFCPRPHFSISILE